ncbi:MAG: hypothetical protein AVDCRST_MAG56-2053, partial [uncultured Cytophagales bacterium]
ETTLDRPDCPLPRLCRAGHRIVLLRADERMEQPRARPLRRPGHHVRTSPGPVRAFPHPAAPGPGVVGLAARTPPPQRLLPQAVRGKTGADDARRTGTVPEPVRQPLRQPLELQNQPPDHPGPRRRTGKRL